MHNHTHCLCVRYNFSPRYTCHLPRDALSCLSFVSHHKLFSLLCTITVIFHVTISYFLHATPDNSNLYVSVSSVPCALHNHTHLLSVITFLNATHYYSHLSCVSINVSPRYALSFLSFVSHYQLWDHSHLQLNVSISIFSPRSHFYVSVSNVLCPMHNHTHRR